MYKIPMELKFLSICHFHIHFHLTPTIEMVPEIAISDHNTIRIELFKQN